MIKKWAIFSKVTCVMYTNERQKSGLHHVHLPNRFYNKIFHPNLTPSFLQNYPTQASLALWHHQNTDGPQTVWHPQAEYSMHVGWELYQVASKKTTEWDSGRTWPLSPKPQEKACWWWVHCILRMGGQDVGITNTWIMLHCPLLLKLFNTHVNAEFWNSVKSIKFICKYINKGSYSTMFGRQDSYSKDEVMFYQMERYISSNVVVLGTIVFVYTSAITFQPRAGHQKMGSMYISHLPQLINMHRYQRIPHWLLSSSSARSTTMRKHPIQSSISITRNGTTGRKEHLKLDNRCNGEQGSRQSVHNTSKQGRVLLPTHAVAQRWRSYYFKNVVNSDWSCLPYILRVMQHVRSPWRWV